MAADAKYESQKVAGYRLTDLACWILEHASDGMERGQIVEGFAGLERRYCGYFTDPCFTKNEKRLFEAEYRRVQPVITKTLRRLEKLGLVHLTRRKRYVKTVHLTEKGKALAVALGDGRGLIGDHKLHI